MGIYISINPDAIEGALILIVNAPTGITYNHQCGGHACVQNEMEGYLIPLAHIAYSKATQELIALFEPYSKVPNPVGEALYKAVDSLLKQIPLVVEEPPTRNADGSIKTNERLTYLSLNREETDEILEAWLPVKSEYGDGVLIFVNSD